MRRLRDPAVAAEVKRLIGRHRHKWTVGDLVIRDNRTLLHSASYFDAERYQRRMLRTCVRGEKPMSSVARAAE